MLSKRAVRVNIEIMRALTPNLNPEGLADKFWFLIKSKRIERGEFGL